MKSRSGFTLFEVMLSVAILTTIVVITVNALSGQFFLRQKIIDRDPFERVMSYIAHHISGAFIGQAQGSIQYEQIFKFVHANKNGNSNLIFTIVNYPALIADTKESNVAQVEYIVENQNNKKQLVAIIHTNIKEDSFSQPTNGIRNILVDDIKEFKLSFWEQKEFVEQWDSTGNEKSRLPKMVKIDLVFFLPEHGKKTTARKQEMSLSEIVYVRNATYKVLDTEPDKYTWQ